jgi:hypothetical protein
MFEDLYDAISMIWSWRWPASGGRVTAVDVERIRHSRGRDTLRLAIAYEFSLGDDGPYPGNLSGHLRFRRKDESLLRNANSTFISR